MDTKMDTEDCAPKDECQLVRMDTVDWSLYDDIDDLKLTQHADMTEMEYYMDSLSVSQTMNLYEVDSNDICGTGSFDLDLSQLLELEDDDVKPPALNQSNIENKSESRFATPVTDTDIKSVEESQNSKILYGIRGGRTIALKHGDSTAINYPLIVVKYQTWYSYAPRALPMPTIGCHALFWRHQVFSENQQIARLFHRRN